MTMMRMINATKSTAPKDAPTNIAVGEDLLLSSAVVRVSVDFAVVRMETIVKDPRYYIIVLKVLFTCTRIMIQLNLNSDPGF